MTKKNKMIQLIDHLEGFMAGLPVGFSVESFYQTTNGITLTLGAPTLGALRDTAPKIQSSNGYYEDTIVHTASASVDNGEMQYSLNFQFIEKYKDFALVFEGQTGVEAPVKALPFGTHAYLDGAHKTYGLSADTAYTFHVHPTHLAAFEEWTNTSGIDILREVETLADEVAALADEVA